LVGDYSPSSPVVYKSIDTRKKKGTNPWAEELFQLLESDDLDVAVEQLRSHLEESLSQAYSGALCESSRIGESDTWTCLLVSMGREGRGGRGEGRRGRREEVGRALVG